VLLLAQVVSVTSAPPVDLSIVKSASGPFAVGGTATYSLTVANEAGPGVDREQAAVTVVDTLPAGLTFASASGPGWSCAAAGQVVTCSRGSTLAAGRAYPPVTLTANVGPGAVPQVTNAARVTSGSYDLNPANNATSLVTTVTGGAPTLAVQRVSDVLADPFNGTTSPKRIPGAIVRYALVVTNTGPGSPDAATLTIVDPIPPNTSLYVAGPGDPVEFAEGAVASGLAFDAATHVSYSNRPGGAAPFDYTPVPDADGVDPRVTALRVAPGGAMAGASAAGTPSFTIRFRVRVN
jgi:uncharacterized repeat protein (TIGR01451 family)